MDRYIPVSDTAFVQPPWTLPQPSMRVHPTRQAPVAALWVFPPETWPLPALPVCDPKHHAHWRLIGPRPRSFDRKDVIVSSVAPRPSIVCSDSQRQRDLPPRSCIFAARTSSRMLAQRMIPARSINVEVGCEETLQHSVHAGSRTPAEIPYLQGGMSEMYRMWRRSASRAWYRYRVLWYSAYL